MTAATLVGLLLGSLTHCIADVFYVVPVSLAWPHPRAWSYPILLPPLAQFTNSLYKTMILCDYSCDVLFWGLPLLAVAARSPAQLDGGRCRLFAKLWALELALLAAHLHPSLFGDDEYHYERFIYRLHAVGGGMGFILLTFASVLALPQCTLALALPAASAPAAAAPPPLCESPACIQLEKLQQRRALPISPASSQGSGAEEAAPGEAPGSVAGSTCSPTSESGEECSSPVRSVRKQRRSSSFHCGEPTPRVALSLRQPNFSHQLY